MFALPIFPGRPTYCDWSAAEEVPLRDPAVKSVRWTLLGRKKPRPFSRGFVLALLIFPGSHPPSIVSVHVLNFCVRDGNRWTHIAINTNYLVTHTGFEPMLTA